MTAWHRTDDRGVDVQFNATPDSRGNVTLTAQELEGLMRTGGWTPGPISHPEPPTTEPVEGEALADGGDGA